MTMTARIAEWLTARGLDLELASRLGIDGRVVDGTDELVLEFIRLGEVVRRKYRPLERKEGAPRFTQDKGGPRLLWNEDALRDSTMWGDPLLITEGEMDAVAAIQAGYRKTVSVPDGAPAVVPAEKLGQHDAALEEAQKYAWMEPVKEHLTVERCPEIILAGDGDEPGAQLNHDLSHLLGRYRCRYLVYPKRPGATSDADRLKDLNEVLLAYGPRGVMATIERAPFIRVAGVYRMEEIPIPPARRVYEIGFDLFGDNYRMRSGDFAVITGVPSSGKSTWVHDAVCRVVERYGLKVAWASFEQDPTDDHKRNFRRWFNRAPVYQQSVDELKAADEWIDRHHLFILSDDEENADLEWLLDKIEVAVLRYGCQIVVLDPWNEMDHYARPGEMVTDYTGRAIKTLKRLARKLNIHLIVVAHPAKMQRKQDGTWPVPDLYDISGCYSDDTEVLTKRGWLRHEHITMDDEVACFDLEATTTTYCRPTRIVRRPHAGPIHHLKGYGYDLLVTPEHRLVVEPRWAEPQGTQAVAGYGRPVKWPKKEWAFCEAADLPSSPFSIPLAAPLADAPTAAGIAEDLARLAGWYVAEGSKVSAGVSISQATGPKADEIELLLVRMGVPYRIYRSAPGGKGGTRQMQAFYIGVRGARPIVQWLHSECGVGSQNVRVPKEILDGPAQNKTAFLEAYLAGDGAKKRRAHSASTVSSALRDDLQRLCLELGLSCSWSEISKASESHSQAWQLNICRTGRDRTALRKSRNATETTYDGTVWCLEVPTGAYFVRRNGKAVACGNSAHWANKCDIGVVIHRSGPDDTEVRNRKSRYHDTIGRPGCVIMQFSRDTGRFIETERGKA